MAAGPSPLSRCSWHNCLDAYAVDSGARAEPEQRLKVRLQGVMAVEAEREFVRGPML